MLTFKRKRDPAIKTLIPPHTRPDVRAIVRTITESADPSKSLAALRPTKLFLKARLNGASNVEAKALAGIPASRPPNEIVREPVAQILLDEVLSLERRFSDKGIVKRLREMWDAKDTDYVPLGDRVIKVKKKNWDVRKFAFTNVLELRGYKKRERENNEAAQATAIHFHVSQIPVNAPIDVQAEPG